MNEKITVSSMLRAIYRMEEEEGRRCTLLGIGPMSEPVIRATFELAKERDFPPLFIASRNQIDTRRLGGGYVRGWDQKDFVDALRTAADETGFQGLYYVCRDHGGPWQRDRERREALPAAEAMAIGKESYREDLTAGFDLLHIDPTKDPHAGEVVPMETVLERTVELIAFAEQERVRRGLAPVDYEVGTEETNGGLTSDEAYSEFIRSLAVRLGDRGLPMPVFIVGQTGTLTRMTENVGDYNLDAALWLSADARRFGVGLKEHNGDYLSERLLYLHPALGVTATNVAPEFGVAETAACLDLYAAEGMLAKKGLLDAPSDFLQVLREETVRGERWRKWMVGADAEKTVEEVLRDPVLCDTITRTGGHYSFDRGRVKQERAKLYANLERMGLSPERAVLNRIKRSIGRYVDCFCLEGITTKIREYAQKQ